MPKVEVFNPVDADVEANEQVEPEEKEVTALPESEEKEGDDAQQGEPEGEVVITLGEESGEEEDHKEAQPWVKELRKSYKATQKENRQLKERLQQLEQGPDVVKLPEKPTMESCDWDADVFEAKLIEWTSAKRKHEEQEQQARKQQEEAQEQVNRQLAAYEEKKKSLKVPDYDEAEDDVNAALNVTQRGIIIMTAEDPAKLMYGLGKNPKLLAEVSKISDPVKFTWRMARLEAGMKTDVRKPPPPEKVVTGAGNFSGAVGEDPKLEELRRQAAKTGDYTKVHAYKRAAARMQK